MSIEDGKPETINSVSVETPQGYKTFSLMQGDITQITTDLLVISSHGDPTLRPTGQVIDSLMARHGMVVDPGCRLLDFAEGRWTCFQRQPEPATFSAVLTVRIPSLLQQDDPFPFFDQAVQGVFASVAALEYMGEAFRVISLPVLYGQRIMNEHGGGVDDYPQLIESMIRHALRWLKKSERTDTVQFVVFKKEEVPAWSAAMNDCLGRAVITSGTDAVLSSLCQENLLLAKAQSDPRLKDATERLVRELAHPELLVIDNICVAGRFLAETVVKLLLEGMNRKRAKKPDLCADIEAVRGGHRVAPWITSYMDSLRIFGNATAHSTINPGYRPTRLDKGDLISALCAIRALLSSWPEMLAGGDEG